MSNKKTDQESNLFGSKGFFKWHLTYAILHPLLGNIDDGFGTRVNYTDIIGITNIYNSTVSILKINKNINLIVKNQLDILNYNTQRRNNNMIIQEIDIDSLYKKSTAATIYQYGNTAKEYLNIYTLGMRCLSNCDTSAAIIKPGQKIYYTMNNTYLYNIQAALSEYIEFNYYADIYFNNPYLRKIQKENVHQYLHNTNSAFKILEDMEFDIPFNPFQPTVYPDSINQSYIVINDGSFIGGTPEISISDRWLRDKTFNKIGIDDISTAFNNKYIQFKSIKVINYPCTTCSSFCSLWGTKYDPSKRKNSSNITELCPCYYPKPTPNPKSSYIKSGVLS